MNIPNILTLLRILLVPILAAAYLLPFAANHVVAASIFSAACITDWLDGYLARVLHQESSLGAFLDPVADKLIVAVALVLIVGDHCLAYLSFPALVIISREIIISALREWMAELGKRASVAVSYVGKVKTFAQMVALIFLLVYKPGDKFIILFCGYTLIYLATILTLWSMIMYLRAAWPELVNAARAK